MKRCSPKVGDRIEVYWTKDKKYYAGKITDFNKTTMLFRMKYDDGDFESLDLFQQRWRHVAPKTEPTDDARILARLAKMEENLENRLKARPPPRERIIPNGDIDVSKLSKKVDNIAKEVKALAGYLKQEQSGNKNEMPHGKNTQNYRAGDDEIAATVPPSKRQRFGKRASSDIIPHVGLKNLYGTVIKARELVGRCATYYLLNSKERLASMPSTNSKLFPKWVDDISLDCFKKSILQLDNYHDDTVAQNALTKKTSSFDLAWIMKKEIPHTVANGSIRNPDTQSEQWKANKALREKISNLFYDAEQRYVMRISRRVAAHKARRILDVSLEIVADACQDHSIEVISVEDD